MSDSNRHTVFFVRVETFRIFVGDIAHGDDAARPQITIYQSASLRCQYYAGAFQIAVTPVCSMMLLCAVRNKERYGLGFFCCSVNR